MPPTPLKTFPSILRAISAVRRGLWVPLEVFFHCLQKFHKIIAETGGNARQFFYSRRRNARQFFWTSGSFLSTACRKSTKSLLKQEETPANFFVDVWSTILGVFPERLGPSRGVSRTLWGGQLELLRRFEANLAPFGSHFWFSYGILYLCLPFWNFFESPKAAWEAILDPCWGPNGSFLSTFSIFYKNTLQHWKLSSRPGESSILEVWSSPKIIFFIDFAVFP